MAVVAGTAQLNAGFNQTVTSGLINTQTLPASIAVTTQYSNGTGAGQIDLLYARQLTFAVSTPQTLDLTAITDLAGATVNFARIRELIIQVVTTTSGVKLTAGPQPLTRGPHSGGPRGRTSSRPGPPTASRTQRQLGRESGPVTSGTSTDLKLDPGAAIQIVNILIAGCSAVS